jgi:hypothetical protein
MPAVVAGQYDNPRNVTGRAFEAHMPGEVDPFGDAGAGRSVEGGGGVTLDGGPADGAVPTVVGAAVGLVGSADAVTDGVIGELLDAADGGCGEDDDDIDEAGWGDRCFDS